MQGGRRCDVRCGRRREVDFLDHCKNDLERHAQTPSGGAGAGAHLRSPAGGAPRTCGGVDVGCGCVCGSWLCEGTNARVLLQGIIAIFYQQKVRKDLTLKVSASVPSKVRACGKGGRAFWFKSRFRAESLCARRCRGPSTRRNCPKATHTSGDCRPSCPCNDVMVPRWRALMMP